MKPLSSTCSLALTLLLGSLGLVGCGGALSFPDAVVSPQVQGPPIQGSIYGGHAPIVGAHVYLLQPGTSGYGSAATSLLGNNGATSASGYAITADVNDPNVPVGVGAKYVTSDASGGFNLTGGYTCTVGQPVYLYSWGTSASTVTQRDTGTTTTTGPQTVTITSISVSSAPQNSNGNVTYTINVSAALPLTAGQTVIIAGLQGNLSKVDSTSGTALTTTTGTQFEVSAPGWYGSYTYKTSKNGSNHTYYETVGTGTYTATSGPAGNDGGGNDNGNAYSVSGSPSTGSGPYVAGTATATETTTTTTTGPTTNPQLELATLGICPSSGNFSTPGTGNGALSYVYMNEVSTVATAYTFQPFTLASNNNAWDIGSSGSTQALVGIANAANTAAQLYDIQGSTLISNTYDGEGHLANFQTLLNGVPNEGNGIVPQATIDSLANILAACIDSSPATGGFLSSQCTTLFNTATDNGETIASGDTAPTDTATAAINIARYPAGNNSGTADSTYAADIFGIPTGTVPYAPSLSNAPNEWTIAINYPYSPPSGWGYASAANPLLEDAESIAVDNIGQIWITAQGSSQATASEVRWSPLGAQNSTNKAGYIYGYISIDGSNNAWAGNADETSGIEEFGSNGVLTNTYGSGYNSAYTVITNNAGDAFFVANTSALDTTSTHHCGGFLEPPCVTTDYYQLFEYGPGGSTIAGSPFTISPGAITAGNNVAHGAIDHPGNLWLTTEGVPDGATNGDQYQIAYVSPTGTALFPSISVGQQPEFPAIDNSGNAWIAIQATASEIYKVTPAGGTTILTSGTTGAELTSTFGAAVDGNGNVWFANRCGNYGGCGSAAGENTLIELNGTGTTTPGTVNTAISPSTNYFPEAQYPATATSFTSILSGSLNLAIDPSGNIWITNYTGNGVVEVVGAAAPVATPLSVAAANNKLGAKP